MDSANSGSFQSSSSGDNDDYDDPRNESSISSFLNLPSTQAAQTQLLPSLSSSFDVLSPYFAFNNSMQTHLTNLEQQREQNCTNNRLAGIVSASQTTTPSISSNPTTAAAAAVNMSSSSSSTTTKGSKKRSRASRRAPTTVLTTDTSNFRAMVQEFTGFPAPPFASSMFPRPRLDVFGGTNSTTTTTAPFLLRPFAHKTPFFPIDAIANSIGRAASNNSSSGATSAAMPAGFALQSLLQSQSKQNSCAELSLPIGNLLKPQNTESNSLKGIENLVTNAQSSESFNRAGVGLYDWNIDHRTSLQSNNNQVSARKQNDINDLYDHHHQQQQQHNTNHGAREKGSSSTSAAPTTRVVDNRFDSWMISSDQ